MIRKKTKKKTDAIVNPGVGNYEKHPFFVRNATAAKQLLHKVGLPKSLTTKAHA